ncbi:FMN-dependent NADH-azoreductase [Kiritimatiella glycovorans]|uniref:FMN dependent NADH:quinone oxidoreductase n=1 Tax=Kiritimatiella glycovorans TaxID=1307763 RepID=A0A0G3EDM2_9BACT|nr:NAD(P)H-dependent oxidoreductase [Kiritimatiella glycovorans]AKJ63492.1 FMN-dependent NADH-azoreductase 1 [Kiritimatiella glycovorans]
MKFLHVCANPKPTEESASKQLATAFFARLMELNPEVEIDNIDLYEEKPPYYTYSLFKRFWYPVLQGGEYEPTREEDAALHYANKQKEHLDDADVLVLTTPMWNFSVPSILKAWMDQVLSPGIMFEFEGREVRPLHRIRSIVLLVASGGIYKEDDERDALSSDVRAAFGFVGITDVRIAWADGQNPVFSSDCTERRALAVESAEELAEDILADLAPATA